MIGNILLLGIGISSQLLIILGLVYFAVLVATIYRITIGKDVAISKLLRVLLAVFVPVIGIVSVWLIDFFQSRSAQKF